MEARTNVGTYNHFGVRANSTATYATDYRLIARDDGNVYGDTSQGLVGTLSSGYASAGSIVAMVIDGNLGQITYYVNGVNVGGPYSIYQYNSSSLPTPYKIYNLANSGHGLTVNFGQNPTFSGNTTAGTFTDSNSKGLFKYQPPSGFLALCEDNLPTPAISDPGEYFRSVLYTGDGNSGRSIVGVGFTPDLVWIKSRSNAYAPEIFDSVRGSTLVLYTNGTNVESTETQLLTSFNSDGFSIGNNVAANGSGNNHVAWCWKAGAGTTSTNTNGSITSVVSVNQDAGFSIVSYTGNGTAGATIGHGLGKAPKFILIKRRSGARNCAVAGSILGSASTLYLNLTNPLETYDIPLIGNIQTSTTFQVGTDTNRNASGGTHIAYCWAEIEGFSKFGSYVGNGSADGPFVYCGFKPALVLIKTTSGGSWVIKDSSRSPNNPNGSQLYANTSAIDDDPYGITDFLSNGFKPRVISQSINASGETYIFAAFAESAFSYSNAK